MKIDNRWSAGASNPPVDIPEFRAAYGARWIDQGDWAPPDVVHVVRNAQAGDLACATALHVLAACSEREHRTIIAHLKEMAT